MSKDINSGNTDSKIPRLEVSNRKQNLNQDRMNSHSKFMDKLQSEKITSYLSNAKPDKREKRENDHPLNLAKAHDLQSYLEENLKLKQRIEELEALLSAAHDDIEERDEAIAELSDMVKTLTESSPLGNVPGVDIFYGCFLK